MENIIWTEKRLAKRGLIMGNKGDHINTSPVNSNQFSMATQGEHNYNSLLYWWSVVLARIHGTKNILQ